MDLLKFSEQNDPSAASDNPLAFLTNMLAGK
jgi:hypothetical protein